MGLGKFKKIVVAISAIMISTSSVVYAQNQMIQGENAHDKKLVSNQAFDRSTDQDKNAKSAYHGSEANKKSINFLQEAVNPATRAFNVNLSLLTFQGYLSQQLKISFSSLNQGMLGLPDGWQYDIDYIVPNKSVTVSGSAYSVDYNWEDSTHYKSGLKYLNQHGVKFSAVPQQALPDFVHNDSRRYSYLLSFPDGSKEYFDASGKLLINADRFNNYISYFYENEKSGVQNNKLSYVIDSLGQRYSFSYASGKITVSAIDGHGNQVTYILEYASSAGGGSKLTRYIDPLGKVTSLSYIYLNGINEINDIKYPSGLETQVYYSNLPYLDANRKSQNINAVSKLVHLNSSSKKVLDTTYYSAIGDYNYTGYPQYALSDQGSDNLMDSDNTKFRYNVISDDMAVNPSTGEAEHHKTRMIYDSMSRLLESDSYAANDDINHPTFKTLYTYPQTSSYHDRTVNYGQPIEVDSYVKDNDVTHNKKATQSGNYRLLSKTIKSYDDYGNTINAASYNYNPVVGKLIKVSSMTQTFDYQYNQPLTSVTETYNPLTDSYQQKTTDNTLSSDHKVVDSSRYFVDSQPWKMQSNTYDSHGELTSNTLSWMQTGHEGVQKIKTSTAYQYDPDTEAMTVTTTDPDGNTTSETKDTITGLVTSKKDALGNVTKYTYDLDGRVLTETMPNGNTVTTCYLDNIDGVSSVIQKSPLGFESKVDYDVSGNEISKYATTDMQNPTKLILQQTNSYDGFGNLTKTTDGFGNVNTTQYNAFGQPILKTDAFGNTISMTYDYADMLVKSYTNKNLIKETYYNANQKPLKQINYPNPANKNNPGYAIMQESLYTGDGNLVEQDNYQLLNSSDGKSFALSSPILLNKTTRYYNGDNKVSKIIFQQGETTEQETLTKDLLDDTLQAAKEINTPSGKFVVTRDKFGYDNNGKVISDTDRLGGVVKFAYDANGNLISKTRRDGTVIYFQYDNDGNKTKMYWHDNTDGKDHSISYTYDKDANLISTNYDGQIMNFNYDLSGKLLSTTYPDGKTSSTSYNALGLPVELTDVNGQKTVYSYDDHGRPLSISMDGNQLNFNYGVDDNGMKGALVSQTVVGQYTEENHVDGLGHPVELIRTTPKNGGKVLLDVKRYFNALGQLTQTVTTSALSPNDPNLNQTKDYVYNALNQLTLEKTTPLISGQPSTQISYAYDGNGNILEKTENGVKTTYSYNTMDQLLSLTKNGQTVNFTYNKNGDQVTDGSGKNYHYNALSQLVSVSIPSQNTQLNYDYYATGLMAHRTVTSTNTSATDSQSTDSYYYRGDIMTAINNGDNLTSFLMEGPNRIAALALSVKP
ncbi:RHS repeat domain-containing protein [Facilibium subflavum]|uniref:RHS repeat domain-containing protein n=1 Tax=Facilibium subflavum TaxID=2219058 RepID=UPI000E653FAC|nr:RHS repeat domain-containing protein [Facilibium subflavum]